jgi:undecaprenyl-diphosphatase
MLMNIQSFDLNITRLIQLIPWPVSAVMPVATFVGLPGIMAAIGTLFAIIFWLKLQPQIALMFALATASLLIPTLLKMIINRTRPDTLYAAKIASSSFPSGHAFDAVVILGMIAYVSWSLPHGPLVVAALGSFALIIGLSRIYLGAHYPTDVLAGWLMGGLTLWAIIHFVQS